MAVKRRPSSSPQNITNAGVRKVQPVADDISRRSDGPKGSPATNGALLGKVRDGVSAVTGTISGALVSGFKAVRNSWFGAKPVAHAASAGVGKVASFLNISKGGAVASLVGLLSSLLLGVGVFIGGSIDREALIKQDAYVDPCAQQVADARAALGVLDPTYASWSDAVRDNNAQLMWGLGLSLGFTPEQCAGMLGNLTMESGLDPTAVEGFGYGWTEEKAVLFNTDGVSYFLPTANMDSHTLWLANVSYPASGISINLNAYRMDPAVNGNYCVGLGLVQWTGPTGKMLLDFAQSQGRAWYELDVQCAHMMSNDVSRLQGFMSAGSSDNVEAMMGAWLGYMEMGLGRPATMADHSRTWDRRLQYAQEWYARFMSGELVPADTSFSDSVMAMAGSATSLAAGSYAANVSVVCSQSEAVSVFYDNSSLASAAVSYAWETKDQSYNNPGTPLYIGVHDAMFPGEAGAHYMSCDRGVGSAVRWSGADDNFPAGDTTAQDAWMMSNPDLWQFMGTYDIDGDGFDYTMLQPGDICITTRERRAAATHSSQDHGHIVMYVGVEATQAVYPAVNTEFVAASIGGRSDPRSPACLDYRDRAYHNQGYFVYRYIGDYSGVRKNDYHG